MIRIDIDDREVRQALERLQQRVSDLTPAMREIAMELEARALTRFETERDPAGRPWQPLSPVTLARKKGRGGILYQTGDLRGSITSRAGRDFAEVGAGGNVPYAATHQFGAKKGQFGQGKRGGKIPWGDIPARPFLPVTADGKLYGDKSVILEIIRKHIADG
ncbi:MAG: phage virion morphogenesis protein [Rhodocyclaceae bacterium]|nr:phage virion morphogenesis protein [Rhodocyclaceae bacterium]